MWHSDVSLLDLVFIGIAQIYRSIYYKTMCTRNKQEGETSCKFLALPMT